MKHLILLLPLLLSACLTESEQPLSEPGNQALDLTLVGTWSWANKNNSGYLHIGKNKNSDTKLRFVIIEVNKNNEIEISEYVGHNTQSNNNNYLNIEQIDENNQSSRYIFVKYNIEAAKLSLSIADSSLLEDAIEDGSLAGYLGKAMFASSVISATPEKLNKFLADNDQRVFSEFITFSKNP